MRNQRRAAVELHQAEPPRQALAKKEIVAVVEHGLREELAACGLRLPIQADREALLTRLARRVLHHAAIATLLQLEAPEGRGGGEPERSTAACRRRQRRQPGAQDRVLTLRTLQGSPLQIRGHGRS